MDVFSLSYTDESVPITEIGRTPEGYVISMSGAGAISIIKNTTLNYTTGEWQITQYNFTVVNLIAEANALFALAMGWGLPGVRLLAFIAVICGGAGIYFSGHAEGGW